MPNKIPEEIKKSDAFLYAKACDLNSRESARFASLFNGDADFSTSTKHTKDVLIAVSREPKVNNHQFQYVLNKNGLQVPTRSKLVMEYNRQAKKVEQIRKFRSLNKEMCDGIIAGVSLTEVANSEFPRDTLLDYMQQRAS